MKRRGFLAALFGGGVLAQKAKAVRYVPGIEVLPVSGGIGIFTGWPDGVLVPVTFAEPIHVEAMDEAAVTLNIRA